MLDEVFLEVKLQKYFSRFFQGKRTVHGLCRGNTAKKHFFKIACFLKHWWLSESTIKILSFVSFE